MRLTLRYFASLREAAGVDCEIVEHLGSVAELYEQLVQRHRFTLPFERLRVAVNGALCAGECRLSEGDEVVFLPPVSGG